MQDMIQQLRSRHRLVSIASLVSTLRFASSSAYELGILEYSHHRLQYVDAGIVPLSPSS